MILLCSIQCSLCAFNSIRMLLGDIATCWRDHLRMKPATCSNRFRDLMLQHLQPSILRQSINHHLLFLFLLWTMIPTLIHIWNQDCCHKHYHISLSLIWLHVLSSKISRLLGMCQNSLYYWWYSCIDICICKIIHPRCHCQERSLANAMQRINIGCIRIALHSRETAIWPESTANKEYWWWLEQVCSWKSYLSMHCYYFRHLCTFQRSFCQSNLDISFHSYFVYSKWVKIASIVTLS